MGIECQRSRAFFCLKLFFGKDNKHEEDFESNIDWSADAGIRISATDECGDGPIGVQI